MKSKSIKGKSIASIKAALQQSLHDGFKPTLAIVFLSINQDRNAIRELLDSKNISVFGSTTNGEFIDENTENQSTAILLLDMKLEHFKIYFEEFQEKNYREVAQNIAFSAASEFEKPAFFISASHLETDAEQLLFGFEAIIGKHVNIFGGMAGDDYAFLDQYVFTNKKESNRGTLVLALDENYIKIKGVATCGWKAVGTEKTVTKSEGNHVYTIDNVPVLDITAKYGGIENVTQENDDIILEIAANFPLQLQREKGDPVMRPGLVIDWNDRSFYCSGTVPQSSKVRFSLPPDFDVMDKVIQGVQYLKDTEMPEADALVVFSCGGRILSLGPLMNDEIEGIKNVWNVPMVGMFSNAELARATGGNLEMHNLTTCCVALKEMHE
ncbi:FIST signal transduction protein [Winogradskyella psychrotolerans]|uniref:FIST signal transduction protein n=1 Tax=Winogradskyella psychrotolerans TaxID=1344585 RepID=UPI001C07CB14|nr:FIST N-terminal domain-containing protein [Winogradskyella psychrotolerans]MBU2929661.1 FIST C-terminal domain-containing protein [Winogradskyella psychrotolerans]